MLARDRRRGSHRQRLVVAEHGDRSRVDAIALAGIAAPPNLQPARDQLRLAGEDPQQHLLVVAEQEDRPDAVAAIGAQPLDHLRRARPAVDQVAEEHEQRLRGAGAASMSRWICVEQLVEQVEPAVDVADDIGAAGPPARSASAACDRASPNIRAFNSGDR